MARFKYLTLRAAPGLEWDDHYGTEPPFIGYLIGHEPHYFYPQQRLAPRSAYSKYEDTPAEEFLIPEHVTYGDGWMTRSSLKNWDDKDTFLRNSMIAFEDRLDFDYSFEYRTETDL